jgi:hypothetical protein
MSAIRLGVAAAFVALLTATLPAGAAERHGHGGGGVHRSAGHAGPARASHGWAAAHGGHRVVVARGHARGVRRYGYGWSRPSGWRGGNVAYGYRVHGGYYAAGGYYAGGGYAYPAYGGSYGYRHHGCWWYRHYEPYNIPASCSTYYGPSYSYSYGYAAPSYGSTWTRYGYRHTAWHGGWRAGQTARFAHGAAVHMAAPSMNRSVHIAPGGRGGTHIAAMGGHTHGHFER